MALKPLERAARDAGWVMLDDVASAEALLADGALVALLFAGDPEKRPEANDIAVILPELQKTFGNRFQVGLVTPQGEKALSDRFEVRVFPTLLLMRGLDIVERIPRLKDWQIYRGLVAKFLDSEPVPAAGA